MVCKRKTARRLNIRYQLPEYFPVLDVYKRQPVNGPNNRPLKSLSEVLKGKQGRLDVYKRQSLYSVQSFVTVSILPERSTEHCSSPS